MIITEKNVNEENKMNFAPLLLILLYFWKNNPSWLKNVLPRLDLPSFAPLFKILGLNDKTVSFLTSEKFAAALSAVFDNDSADLKSILPALCAALWMTACLRGTGSALTRAQGVSVIFQHRQDSFSKTSSNYFF